MSSRKNKLLALDSGTLADALLELSARYPDVDDYIDRLLASPEESVTRFKLKVAALHGMSDFIGYSDSHDFSSKLSEMLDELSKSSADPKTGLQLVASFIETDGAVFNCCDDSSGMIGEVYSGEAVELFAACAAKCKDKDFIEELILKLLEKDEYGVRGNLLESAGKILPKKNLRSMFEFYRRKSVNSKDSYSAGNASAALAVLARQMKDPELLIELRTSRGDGQVWPRDMEEIARLYYDCKDYSNALLWLQKIPEDQYVSYEFRKQIFKKLDMTEELETLCRKLFRGYRSKENLGELLEIIGKDKYEKVVADETAVIMSEKHFSSNNVAFLIEIGRTAEAAEYVIQRHEKIDGMDYYQLSSLLKPFKKAGFLLAATAIFRALLDSILERKNAKAYVHGAEYWTELNKIAPEITDWRTLPNHPNYAVALVAANKRKSAFWARVDEIYTLHG